MRFTKDKYGFNKKTAEKIIRLMSVFQIFLMSIITLNSKTFLILCFFSEELRRLFSII